MHNITARRLVCHTENIKGHALCKNILFHGLPTDVSGVNTDPQSHPHPPLFFLLAPSFREWIFIFLHMLSSTSYVQSLFQLLTRKPAAAGTVYSQYRWFTVSTCLKHTCFLTLEPKSNTTQHCVCECTLQYHNRLKDRSILSVTQLEFLEASPCTQVLFHVSVLNLNKTQSQCLWLLHPVLSVSLRHVLLGYISMRQVKILKLLSRASVSVRHQGNLSIMSISA